MKDFQARKKATKTKEITKGTTRLSRLAHMLDEGDEKHLTSVARQQQQQEHQQQQQQHYPQQQQPTTTTQPDKIQSILKFFAANGSGF